MSFLAVYYINGSVGENCKRNQMYFCAVAQTEDSRKTINQGVNRNIQNSEV